VILVIPSLLILLAKEEKRASVGSFVIGRPEMRSLINAKNKRMKLI